MRVHPHCDVWSGVRVWVAAAAGGLAAGVVGGGGDGVAGAPLLDVEGAVSVAGVQFYVAEADPVAGGPVNCTCAGELASAGGIGGTR